MSFDLNTAWERVADMAGWIVSAFGAPAAVAARLILMRKDRQDMLAWLGPIEALARRLLLIEAAALPAPNTPAAFAARGRIVCAYRDTQPAALAEDPAQWRVRFNLGLRGGAPSAPRAAGLEAHVPKRGPAHNAEPLARRLEALLRLAEDRAGAVRRLSRFLHTRPVETAAAFAPYRLRATPCAEMLGEVQSQADLVRARFANSS